MIATAEGLASAKPKKRTAAKASARTSAQRVKQTLVLSEDSARRLAVHAAMVGLDRSALVDQLIQEHLRRFRVSDLGGCHNGSIGETGTAA